MAKQSEISKKYILDMDLFVPKIIDYIVDFFGEHHREKIVENLSDIYYTFTAQDEDMDFFFEDANKKHLIEEYNKDRDLYVKTGGYYKRGTNSDIEEILADNIESDYEFERNFISEDSYKYVTEQKNVFTLSALQTLFFNLFSDDDYSYGHFLHDIAPDFSKVNPIIHFDLREPVYDTTIIHEHVHACSLFMRIVAKNIAEGGTGFLKSRQLKGIIGETEGKSDYDNAMLIDVDEMFTEYFTSLIVAKMLNDNYVIVRPEDENYDNIYRVGFPAMDVFFNNFLQEAKEFYINNDIQGLKNWMGKNNFKKFAKALGKFARLSPDNLADDWDWLDGDKPLSYIYANIESYGDRVNDSEYFSAMRDIKEVTDVLIVKYKSNDDSDDSEPK